MEETDKLRVFLSHWIEHNEEHAAEFLRLTKKAGPAQNDVRGAANAMKTVNRHLSAALEKLGGPLDHLHSHDH